ncbi:MAG: RecQ family zinc-binding domain-containing protein [Merdibacter sp.]
MQADAERLDEMIGYCKTARCLERLYPDYFVGMRDQNCGNCKAVIR